MLHDRDYMHDNAREGRRFAWPDAVTLLIAANVLVFVLQHVFLKATDRVLLDGTVVLHPLGALSVKALAEGRIWTIVTHLFIHGNAMHLIGNCLGLFFAGRAVLSLLGRRHLLLIYFMSGVMGAALELAVGWISGMPLELIGASACVYGVFLALAVMLPNEVITALFYLIIPVRIRLWNLARIILGISVVFGLMRLTPLREFSGGIAHFAHLGGALTGWFIVRWLGYGGPSLSYDKRLMDQRKQSQDPEMAVVRSRRRVVDLDEPDAFIIPPQSTREFIEREIDPILDKIHAHGISSLTDQERQVLERARAEIMNRSGK